jgi:hypothetical protein
VQRLLLTLLAIAGVVRGVAGRVQYRFMMFSALERFPVFA